MDVVDPHQVKLETLKDWVFEFAKSLGKSKPPQVCIGPVLCYLPLENAIVVPSAMLCVDVRLLRLAIAHECGHYNRRWISMFAKSDMAKLAEEALADKVSLALTGESPDILRQSIKATAQYEFTGNATELDTYIDDRLSVLDHADKLHTLTRPNVFASSLKAISGLVFDIGIIAVLVVVAVHYWPF